VTLNLSMCWHMAQQQHAGRLGRQAGGQTGRAHSSSRTSRADHDCCYKAALKLQAQVTSRFEAPTPGCRVQGVCSELFIHGQHRNRTTSGAHGNAGLSQGAILQFKVGGQHLQTVEAVGRGTWVRRQTHSGAAAKEVGGE
jgi:hypothetical protein